MLIIALLIIVAAPAFLGQQNKANDSKTQQEIVLLYKNLKSEYTTKEEYSDQVVNTVKNNEPQLNYQPVSANSSLLFTKNQLQAQASSTTGSQTVTIIGRSSSGKDFCMVDKSSKAPFKSWTATSLTEITEAGCPNGGQYAKANGQLFEEALAGAAATAPPAVLKTASVTIADNPANTITSGQYVTIGTVIMLGSVLTADITGVFSENPTSYSYQWQKCLFNGTNCTDIPGATSSQYTAGTTNDEIGKRIQVKITATNNKGSITTTSTPTTQIAAKNTLQPGKVATVYGRIYSPNGRFFLVVLGNNAIGIYERIPGSSDVARWNTAGGATNSYAVLVNQLDGNVVLYSNPFTGPIWNTVTVGETKTLYVNDTSPVLTLRKNSDNSVVWSAY